MTQNFKGDALELKMRGCGDPLFDITNAALDDFYANGFECTPFILMLYDEGRMPFSDRIPRDAFVGFVLEALKRFPFTGIFETYIFVLKSVFGPDTEIDFDVPNPGELHIDVAAVANTEFQFIGREFIDGEYFYFDMIDGDGALLQFRGVPGISTEYELNLLFSEIIPIGISPTISLEFITRYEWIAEEPGPLFYSMIADNSDSIIFYEVGG